MRILCTFLILCIAVTSMAQLSGTYTIGGSNPDYATLQEAVTDLGVQGVSASVEMLVRDGVYEESFQIPSIAGSGGEVWVTFRSESGVAENVIWQSALPAAQYYHWELMGVNNLRLEGITFSDLATDQQYYYCWGSETTNDGLQFLDCRFTSVDTLYSAHIGFWTSTGDVLVEDCYFGPADEGLYVTGGGSDLHVIGCTFESRDNMLDFESFQSVIIEGNHFNGSGPYFVEAIDNYGFIDSVIFRENTISGNVEYIDFYDGSNSIIFENNLFETTECTIGIEYCQNLTLIGNRLAEGAGYDLQTEYGGNVLCLDNEISEVEFYENFGDILFEGNKVIGSVEHNDGLHISSDGLPFSGEIQVLGNEFQGNHYSVGIELRDINLSDNAWVQISNNSFMNVDGAVEIDNVNRVMMTYNSISVGSDVSSIIEVSIPGEIEFSNNIIANIFDDSADCWEADTLDFIVAHNNVYFWPASNGGVFFNGQGDFITTLADAQALGLEINSIFVDPQFYNDSLDLRICNADLQAIGVETPEIETDYFGVERPTAPTPGFYEFQSLDADFDYSQDQSLVSFIMENCSSAESILWDFGDGNTSTLCDPTHYYGSTGNFTVSLTVSNQCGPAQTTTQVVVVGSVGLDEAQDQSWKMYPNPSQGLVNIHSEKPMEQIAIFDITGRHMQSFLVENEDSRNAILDLSSYPAGIYFVNIISEYGKSRSSQGLLLQ